MKRISASPIRLPRAVLQHRDPLELEPVVEHPHPRRPDRRAVDFGDVVQAFVVQPVALHRRVDALPDHEDGLADVETGGDIVGRRNAPANGRCRHAWSSLNRRSAAAAW
jgi:hypothetical protein